MEMMLVIFLIGLTAGSVMIIFPPQNAISARNEAEQFYTFIKQARDTAAMRGQTMGVQVLPRSYRLMLRKDGVWGEFNDNFDATCNSLPSGIKTTLELGGYSWSNEYESELQRRRLSMSEMTLELQQQEERFKTTPQIWLSVLEPTIPFSLSFYEEDTRECWKVSMDASGELSNIPCSGRE